jgi:FtsH-binding integral membrane protein
MKKSQHIISYKVLPSVSLGILIWLITFLFVPQYTKLSLTIVVIILNFALWIAAAFFAQREQPLYSFIIYLAACFFMGLLSSPIVSWLMSLPRITDVIAQGIITTSLLGAAFGVSLGAYFGWLKRDSILTHNKLLWFLMIFGIGIIVVEVVGVDLLGYSALFFWTSIGVVILMLIFSIYDGAQLRTIVEEDPDLWMMAVISFFLNFVNIAIRLIYILAKAYSDRSS